VRNPVDLWNEMLSIIEKEVSPLGFETWIKTIKPYRFQNQNLILTVPLEWNKDMIEKRYLLLIKNALILLAGNDCSVEILVEDEAQNLLEEDMASPEDFSGDIQKIQELSNLNPKYTFSSFVIGESNRLACAAAQAVSEKPAESYNPLFLYGDVGLGKTHLMHAIGNSILKNNKEAKILYITSEMFINDLVNAIKDNKNEDFRNKYRNLDVLMVDDIQFIGSKELMQQEFFHTFNHLHQSNKQIILSSDRPPKDISTLESRLRSRFEWGLICDIKQPDYETRVAILKKKVQTDHLDISDDILTFIAERVKSNIRELEGVLNRLTAYSQLTKMPITKDMVQDMIKDITETKVNRVVNVDTIILETANYFDMDPKELKSKTRKQEVVNVRQIAMYIIRELTGLSYKKIGEDFSGRDHTTVMSSINKVEDQINEDENLKNNIEEIISNIKNMM